MANTILDIQHLKREFKMGSETVRALKGRSLLIIDYGHAPAELLADLGGPFLAATTSWIAMDCDRYSRGTGDRDRRGERSKNEFQWHIHLPLSSALGRGKVSTAHACGELLASPAARPLPESAR